MNAADLLARAEQRAARLTMARRALPYLIGAALVSGAYCRGKAVGSASARVADAKHVVATAETVRAAVVETVTVAAHATSVAADRARDADALVRVIDPTTLAVQATPTAPAVVFSVPPPVVARIEADSALIVAQKDQIVALNTLIVADSGVIVSQRAVIRALEDVKAPRCGMRCGIALGAGGVVTLVGAIAVILH